MVNPISLVPRSAWNEDQDAPASTMQRRALRQAFPRRAWERELGTRVSKRFVRTAVMLETVEFLWSRLLFYSLWFSILCLMLGFIETGLLVRKGGTNLKRGFKIYGRPLTIKEKEFLQALNEDIFTEDKIFLGTFDRGFIRQKQNEYLIRSRSYDWRTAWPYVGYVNLAQPNPELHYRISLFMHLALLVTVVSGIGLLFTGPVMYINFRSETGTLNEYLQNLIDNHLEPKQTES